MTSSHKPGKKASKSYEGEGARKQNRAQKIAARKEQLKAAIDDNEVAVHEKISKQNEEQSAKIAKSADAVQLYAEQESSRFDLEEQELARRVLARRSLLAFILRFEPQYHAGWVHKLICEELEQFFEQCQNGESPRLMLFMPPRGGKSLIASHYFPAWALGHRPDFEFISTSYSSQLAETFSRKARGLLKDPNYKSMFNTRLDESTQAVGQWLTNKKGGYVAAGVGGGITGKGCNCVSTYLTIDSRRGTIPIGSIRVGDEVWAYDHNTEQERWARVKAVSAGYRKDMLWVENKIHCTPDHQVWTENRGYIPAGEFDEAVDSLKMSSLHETVCPEDKRSQCSTSQAGKTRKPQTSLLTRMRSWGQKDRARNNMQMRGEKSAPRIGLSEMLFSKFRRQISASKMPSMRKRVSQKSGRVRQSNETPKEPRRFLLQQRLLQYLPGRKPGAGGTDKNVPLLWRAYNGTQKAKVLWARLLYQTPSCADQTGWVQKLYRFMVYTKTKDCDTRHLLQVVPDGAGVRGAPHRSYFREPRQEQLDNVVQNMPYVISSQRGVCAEDICCGVQGNGFPVVDIQTDTGNFFGEGYLLHNCLIIDDPVRNQEDADSFTVREMQKGWYESTAYTRLAPGGGVLIIQTRWHMDDLSGWLEEKSDKGEGDKFRVVRFPAIANHDELYRKKGEALHPERYDIEAFKRIERAVGPRTWAALYQQNPVPDDGVYFKKPTFHWYEALPEKTQLRFYSSWDLAIGVKEVNDYTVGIIWAVDPNENVYIVNYHRGHFPADEIIERIISSAVDNKCQTVTIEKGQILMSLGPALNKSIQDQKAYSFLLHPMGTRGQDKMLRARSIQARMQQGRVYFPKNFEGSEVHTEMLQFPSAKHDDFVDAMAYIGLFLEEAAPGTVPVEPKEKSWRDRLPALMQGPRGLSSMAS